MGAVRNEEWPEDAGTPERAAEDTRRIWAVEEVAEGRDNQGDWWTDPRVFLRRRMGKSIHADGFLAV